MEFTRRSFGLAAASTALLPVLPAAAKEAPAGAQAPGIYRLKIGAFEVTVLNDGSAALPTKYFLGRRRRRREIAGERLCRQQGDGADYLQ